LLFRFSGSFLLRFDTRAFLGLLFQEPPRGVSGLVPIGVLSQKNFRGRLRRPKKKGKGKKEQREINSQHTEAR